MNIILHIKKKLLHKKSVKNLVLKLNILCLTAIMAVIILSILLSDKLSCLMVKHDSLNELISLVDHADNDNYNNIEVPKYIGHNGYIEILDENLNIIYAGDNNYSRIYTAEIINFISDVDKNTSYYISSHKGSDAKNIYVISEYSYNDGENGEYFFDDNNLSGTAIFNENYKLIYSDITPNVPSLTESNIKALFENNDESFAVKHSFLSSSGKKRYLIAHLDYHSNPQAVFNKRYISFSIIFCIALSVILSLIVSRLIAGCIKNTLCLVSNALNEILNGKVFEKDSLLKVEEFSELADELDETGIKLREKRLNLEKKIKNKIFQTDGYIHDIKNSIMSITACCNILQSSSDFSDENRHFLKIILSSVQDAYDLLIRLCDYNKINSPDFSLKLKSGNLASFFRRFTCRAISELTILGFKYETKITLNTAETMFDEPELFRALNNIIKNFIKYCEHDKTVYFAAYQTENKCIMELGNNGSPIDQHIKDSIFKPYVRGAVSKTEGIGLGLALTDKIISMHSGKIKLIVDNNSSFVNLFHIEIPTSSYSSISESMPIN